MRETLSLIASGLLCWSGFALLALSQERHLSQFYNANRPANHIKIAQAAIIFIAFCLALWLCVQIQGAGFGSLLWLLLLSASAVTVALQLAWAPHHIKPLAWLVRQLVQCDFSFYPPR